MQQNEDKFYDQKFFPKGERKIDDVGIIGDSLQKLRQIFMSFSFENFEFSVELINKNRDLNGQSVLIKVGGATSFKRAELHNRY